MNLPRTYVLSLIETPKRTQKCDDHFAERDFPNFEFFRAIDGIKFGLRTIFPYDVDNPGTGCIINGKPIGIWLSHYMCWAAALTRPASHVSIMEDDVKLPEDWNARVHQALEDVPQDFDMLYLGSCACKGHPMTRGAGDIYHMEQGSGPQCLHSYVVAKKALPVLLDTQRKIYAPIDASLVFHSHPLLKVYVVLPEIIGQWDTVYPP